MSTCKTGEPWTAVDFEQIKQMVAEKTPIRTICARLGRTQAAVYRKASQMGISLRPDQDSNRGRQRSAQALQRTVYLRGTPDLTLFGLLLQMNKC
jgi:hypothetical protein